MKKAELIKVKPLMATDRMIKQAVNDIGTRKQIIHTWGAKYNYTEYKTFLYFRARKQGNILEICLFTRTDLAKRDRMPRYRIFLDRDKECHATYECAEEKWRTAKIDNLPCGSRTYYVPEPNPVASESTIKMVNEYFHTGCRMDIKQAVLDFQTACAKDRIKKKHRLETDQIDYYMNMVPELPKDFDRFVEEYGFYHAQYIFYKDKTEGYCTHCGRIVPIKKKVRHNEKGKCSKCGSSITYKSWNKQKYCDTEHVVSIIQKCTDEKTFIYRQFKVKRKVHRDSSYIPEMGLYENYRVVMNEYMRACYEYEWGEFRHTGVNRWCVAGSINRGMYYHYSVYSSSVLYHGNLKKLLKDTKLKYVPLVEIIKRNPGEKFNVCGQLNDMCCHDRFPYEAFWKMGMKNLVSEHLFSKGGGLTRFDFDRDKPWHILRISKEVLNQAIEMNVTDQQMRIIQRAYEIGVRLEDEQIMWMDTYLGVSEIIAYFRVQTPHRIIRFLKEHVGVGNVPRRENETLRYYMDYLDTARQLGWDMRDRSIFFPQDIKRAHDEAVQLLNEKKDELEAAKRKETDKKMYKNARDIRKVFDYTDDEFEIIVPEKYLDFKGEGNTQHNCVATYYDRAVEGKTIILFIRRKKEPDKSFCTVEIKNIQGKFTIIQNRIIYNKEAPKEAKEFMNKAVEEAQKKVEKELKKKQKIKVAV